MRMKLNPFRTHLHSQVIWPFIIVSILLGTAGALVGVALLGDLVEEWVNARAASVANLLDARTDAYAQDLTRSLGSLAARAPFIAATSSEGATVTTALSEGQEIIGADALVLLDASGVVVASTSRAHAAGARLADMAGDPWPIDAASYPRLLPLDGGCAVAAGVPLELPGGEPAFLVACSSAARMMEIELGAGLDAAVAIVDGEGTIRTAVVPDGFADERVRSALADEDSEFVRTLGEAATGGLGTLTTSIDGHEYRVVLRPLEVGGRATVRPMYSASIVDAGMIADAKAAAIRAILAGAIIALAALLLIGRWVARRVFSPLVVLSESVSRVAEGDFDVKVYTTGSLEVHRLADDFNRMTDSLREHSESLTKKIGELGTLYEMSRSLGTTLDLDTLLESVVESVKRIFDAEIGYIVMVDRESGRMDVRSAPGERLPGSGEAIRSSMGEWVIREGRPLIFNPLAEGDGTSGRVDEVSGAVAALCVPMLSAEGTVGAITVGSHDSERRFNADDVRLLATIANHVTIAIGNISLFSSVQEAYLATVRALAAAIDAKDPYTRGHSDGVAEYALKIGQSMNLSPDQMMALEMAAYLHDIGKIGISEDILLKPGKLTEVEMGQMRHHPLIGANILKPVAFPWPIAPIVRHHHEQFDGRGYPAGLRSDEIPLLARILTVADSFEAMVSDRPYRRGRSPQEAMLELRRCAGTQFDPRITEAFIGVLESSQPTRGEAVESGDEADPGEVQAVCVALCEGMFSSFRKLGGPRLAANLETAVNEELAGREMPVELRAGKLAVTRDDGIPAEDLADAMCEAVRVMEGCMGTSSGEGLVGHFLADAVLLLPPRLRVRAAAIGLMPPS